jgi:outer membrane protein insertion porin family
VLSLPLRRLLFFAIVASAQGSTVPAWAETRGAARSSEAPPRRVVAIGVEGNRRVGKDAILARLGSRVGETVDREKIRSDIGNVYRLGRFDAIEVEEVAEAGGVKLIFRVQEKPVIAKLVFQGMDEISEEDRKDVITVREFEALDVYKLNETVQKLQAKYEEKGFYLAEVRYDVKVDRTKDEATVTFRIQENDRISVKSIQFLGNKVVSEAELKRVMQTKEGDFLSWMTGSGSYREALFERDLQALSYYYGTLGYVRARIDKPRVTVSPDRRYLYISIPIEEGEKYNVGKVDFSGELLFTRAELEEGLALVPGETFNTEILRQETLRYTEKYGDLGYAYANVVPQPQIHDDTKTVDITFDVETGERVYFGRIFITGNTKTKDKVIRRELRIVEGELYSGTRKRESRENVMRLGFFESVDFQQTTSRVAPNIVDVEIKVRERSTGQLVIGAGYASGNIGFTAQAQLSQNNFLGNGQVASLSAQLLTGQSLYEFNAGFTEPFVGASLWSLGGDLFHIKRNIITVAAVRSFEETKTGFNVRVGHPVSRFTNLFLAYKLENSSVPSASILDRSIITPESVNGVASSVTGTVTYDKRDDRFDPRNGIFASASSEVAGFGGNRKFIRSRGTFKFFHPIVWDFVFRFHTTVAKISQFDSMPVPINELFIQGGLFSLRGYDFLSIGPKRTISTDPAFLSEEAKQANLAGRQFVLGGTNEALLNAEIEFPLLREARIRGVVFFDAGNAWNGALFQQNPVLYANVGWGFRWFTPIGPLRFEFGYPIFQSGPSRFYFTIGPPF